MPKSKQALAALFSFFLFCLGGSCPLSAQGEAPPPSFYFEILELPGGLMTNHVQAIAQDSFGFLWFGSQFGLYRWDGYQLKAYLHDPADPASIASDYVECIYVAKDGTLWLGHWGHGLDRFDYDTETFQHFAYNRDSPDIINSSAVAGIIEDSGHHLWLGTHHGVYRLNIKTGQSKQFLHDPNEPNSLSNNKCRSLFMDSEGSLWFGTGVYWDPESKSGLNRYRPETEDFVRYQHDPNDPNSLINNKVTAIFEDSRGNFWVGTAGDGLHLMDRRTGKFQRLQQDPNDPTQLCGPFPDNTPDMHIRFILEDRNRHIWVGAWNGGIMYYEPETGYVQKYYYDENNPLGLPDKFIWQMMQSRDGTFWGCTAGTAAKIFKVREKSFESFPLLSEENIIYSFCESRDQKLWIGTETTGLLTFDKKSKTGTPFRLEQIRPATSYPEENGLGKSRLGKSNLLNYSKKIIEDEKGGIWIKGNVPEGFSFDVLRRIDPETGELRLFQHDPEDDKSLGAGEVVDIFKDERGRIWIATAMGDLNLYEPEEGHFIRYSYASSSNRDLEFGYNASKIAQARNGQLWMAVSSRETDRLPFALARFDPLSGEFTPVDAKLTSDGTDMEGDIILHVEESQAGDVWICSEGCLRKINPEEGASKYFSAADFGSRFFRGMAIDNQQRLWLLGDNIILFDPDSGTTASFDADFNVNSLPVYHQAVFKDSEGMVYIGGMGGFQTVDPQKISRHIYADPPASLIHSLEFLYQQDEQESKEKRPPNILTTDAIELAHGQNSFSFRFAALSFHHPPSNRYEFLLEGYDEQWRAAGKEPLATYVKVPPGSYTFKVRSASRNSEWGPEQSIRVHISPPWWAAWWAYVSYALLVSALLYALYNFQLARKLEKAEALRLKELDAVKTRLYTNITHEFRTPLTVISGMATQMKENPKEWFSEGLAMIQRNSNRLLELVNQMLDLSKLENGKLSLNLQQGEIVRFLKYLVESYHSFAENRQVQLHFHAEEEEVMMDFDAEKIKQIITNLLSNAVKFTPQGGYVYISAEVEGRADSKDTPAAQKHAPTLKIKVRDTGQGIAEAQIPYIFDRFFQAPLTGAEGTGIGLALAKELAHLMGGSISVKSKLGKGTNFTLLLPIKNEAPLLAPSEATTTAQHSNASFAGSPSLPGQKAGTGPLVGLQPEVLLIEDHPDVVAYIASCLQKEYRVLVGKDGQEGIDIAIETIPDLIITDVMMPYKDGFEVCHKLKNDERTSHIPIIMLTAKSDMESKLEGLERGADAYLTKPFHKEELLLRIKKLMELRENLQQYYLSSAGLTEGATIIKDVPQMAQVDDYFVKKARKTVETHLDDFEFNVEELCKAMNLSHSQLHRKLSALTGYSAQKFIRYIRLAKAKELLQNPDLSITAIALDTGFNDPSYFGRVFRQEFGVAPTEWREKMVP